MNCAEFRQYYLAEPRCQDGVFLEHKQACHACAEFAAQEATFEQALGVALAVETPANLAARVILNQTLHQAQRRRTLVATAAVVLLAMPVAAWLLWPLSSSLEQDVIAHITAEREHLAARERVSDDKVAAVLDTLGVLTQQPLTNVRYAGICPIRRHPGGHLVLTGTHGPVTVLFMPHETINRQRPIEAGNFHGIIVPHGRGSIAIVGQSGEALDTFKQQLLPVVPGSPTKRSQQKEADGLA